MFRKVISRAAGAIRSSAHYSTINTGTNAGQLERSINTVTLLGRTGSEPQKRGNSEHPVIVFTLATHTSYKYDNGDFLQRTDWHKISVFKPGLRDSVYTYLKKGQRIMVRGRLNYGEYTDSDGNSKTTATIVADDIIFFQT